MNKSLQVFNNGIFSIRTINDNGIVWFVAKDIAEALDYTDATISNTKVASNIGKIGFDEAGRHIVRMPQYK